MSLLASLGTVAAANVAGKGVVAASSPILEIAKNRAKAYLGGKVVAETEQVDEFAGPIYTGVAASAAPNSSVGTVSPSNELSPEFRAVEAKIGQGNNIRVLSSEKVFSGTAEPKNGVFVESVLFKERIIDMNQQRIGSFRTVLSDIRNGKTPTLGQCLLALVDIATLGFISPLLKKVQLQPAQYRLRWVQVEQTSKELGTEKPTTHLTTVPKTRTQKDIRVKETATNEDVTISKQYDAQVSNFTVYSTEAMNIKAVDALAQTIRSNPDVIGKGVAVAPRDIVEHATDIERKSLVRLREQIREKAASYDSETEFYRIGMDLKKTLGKNVTETDRVEKAQDTFVYHDFVNEAGHLDLDNTRRYKDAMEKLSAAASSQSTTIEAGKGARTIDAPTNAVHFKNGWITWVPGGSIANLGLKKGLHAKLAKVDYISAGIDAATIAVAWAKCAKAAKIAGGTKAAVGAKTAKTVAVGSAKSKGGAAIGKSASSWDKLLSNAQKAPIVREIRSLFPKPISYTRPGGFRGGIRNKVWDAAKDAHGRVRDPLTGRYMSFNKPWDMGHRPGYEFRTFTSLAKKHGMKRADFLNHYNDVKIYRPELPSSNRCHKLEDVTGIYLGEPFIGEYVA